MESFCLAPSVRPQLPLQLHLELVRGLAQDFLSRVSKDTIISSMPTMRGLGQALGVITHILNTKMSKVSKSRIDKVGVKLQKST